MRQKTSEMEILSMTRFHIEDSKELLISQMIYPNNSMPCPTCGCTVMMRHSARGVLYKTRACAVTEEMGICYNCIPNDTTIDSINRINALIAEYNEFEDEILQHRSIERNETGTTKEI